MNDKPIIFNGLNLPAFTISTEFGAGSGMPKQWKGHVPFPSNLYTFKPKDSDLTLFESKRLVVFFRGRFSDNVWIRFKNHKFQWENTPRFNLDIATSNPDDEGVLDIKLKGFDNVKEPLLTEIKEYLKWDYTISLGKFVDSADASTQ